ncbi:DUF2332 domain-containing protein [Kineosporia succinea]|uniref:DUF2332 domain-containing protein n=1 Tax=Kineosporia succinea TaxID=84632 RepID=A0ABT9PFI3_9ACTN|nr:DUF2332 domain-containing protein [Kineosporia succinea]MDP9830735.1 hypothetical protein [Kineosporia succinea]
MAEQLTPGAVGRSLRLAPAHQDSPLYRHLADAFNASPEALRAIDSAPPRRRNLSLVLAALHDRALAGHAPELAAAYVTQDPEAAAGAAIGTLLQQTAAVVEIVGRRTLKPDETGHHAVLYPAIAEVARRAGARRIGLVEVGCSAGLNLGVDRAGITYGNGQTLGDASSAVRTQCAVVGPGTIPTTPLPEVVARIGLDEAPLDLGDPDDARWLRACRPPDRPDPSLLPETALAAGQNRVIIGGDPLENLPGAFRAVPTDAVPVVLNAWALNRFTLERRLRFLNCLDAAATHRPIGWASVEGVGVAPGIATFGDRPASGHSIIGLGVFGHATVGTEAVGRVWSRGRLMSWVAR